jgi:metal-dependent amidase/aminoacylase/carboxypeptidase family protein
MWHELEKSSMGGEDFSYYLRECGGVFCDIGMGENHPAIHNPYFDFEDQALRNGIIFFVAMTLKTMGVG